MQQIRPNADLIDWDAQRFLHDVVAALTPFVPAPLEVAITDHGQGIGIARDGQLAYNPAFSPHYGLIAAMEPREPMMTIAGRLLQALDVIGDTITIALTSPWPTSPTLPDVDERGHRRHARPWVRWTGRTLTAGWTYEADAYNDVVNDVVLALPPLMVYPSNTTTPSTTVWTTRARSI